MEALSLEKMESLVGGSNYCDTAWILLFRWWISGE